ncbi:unnamed protein product [Medioppia subpectinata]|uniref:Nocturnin n=1 Tax=Medioppia subpectinata TaxID=1979941 RepID=A0A7R9KDN9_9ACAR|nr:unnamed protein product [Medioppia subpectinata]CAG2100350.1 unnamed protein product [Medioppia subpectinata]
MMNFCDIKLKDDPSLISRRMIRLGNTSESNGIRIMSWNICSEALAIHYDRFDTISADDLHWSKRVWKIVVEVLSYSPIDIICMQETNQVVLCSTFKHIESGREVCVATTHLKARRGPILSVFRNEQGKDLMKYLAKKAKNIPLVLSGDFNAEPNESVYKTITSQMVSAYKEGLKDEPIFTTWTKRQSEKELKRTLDYIFFTKNHFKVTAIVSPESQQLTKPMPNGNYPSDHLSLITHLNFIN